jgi:transposase
MDEQAKHECPNCRRLEKRVAELERQVAHLTALLEESRRAGKRQAAPFRKPPKAKPKKPGRKPGGEYGEHHRRAVPPPERIDETHEAPLPERCPHCGGGRLAETGVAAQYQVEIPRRPIHRQFNVRLGRCGDCGRAVRGRHALQTSDALGAAAVGFGPDAQAAVALLNKEMGLSHGKVAGVLRGLFGLKIARSASVRSMLRTARRLEPAHEEIRQAVRGSPAITPDETGWRVGGRGAWLHVFAAAGATCYEIDPTRSADPLAALVGRDWTGALIHDGWPAYDRFEKARHQQCLAHLLRRCGELLETAAAGAVRFPRAAADLLRRALEVRDRRAAGEIGDRGRSVLRGRLRAEMSRLVAPVKKHAGNERLAAFLERHLDDLFAFLREPEIDATNWRAEQAIRPAVVNRKVWGGNRAWSGARAQSVLMSVLRTCRQQSLDPLDFLGRALRSTTPVPLFA